MSSDNNNNNNNNNNNIPTDIQNLNFMDPGVSNGDVDWLFRGREIKKLSKKSNTISNEVQSQLIHAQQKALIQSKNNNNNNNNNLDSDTDVISNPIPIPTIKNTSNTNLNSLNLVNRSSSSSISNSISNSLHDLPLKSSLKSNSPGKFLKLDTNVIITSSSPPINNDLNLSQFTNSPTSTSQLDSPLLSSSQKSFNSQISQPQSQPSTPTQSNRSRSSSLFGRKKSPSNASDHKPVKKSLLSSLSSKLKPLNTSTQNSNSNLNSNSIQINNKSSTPNSPSVSRNSSVSRKVSTPSSPLPQISQPSQQLASSPQQQQSPLQNQTPKRINSSDNSLTKLAHVQNFGQNSSNSLTLTDIKLDSIKFKRVCFSLDKLIEDPQQQIPSRRPKKGNVLIPEDMLAPPPKLSIGITNSFNEQTKDEKPKVDPDLYKQAIERHNIFLEESKKHSNEAHIAALRMAKEVLSFKKGKHSISKNSHFNSDDEDTNNSNYYNNYNNYSDNDVNYNDIDDDDDDGDEEEGEENDDIYKFDEKLDIDTPLHTHVNYFGNDDDSNTSSENNNDNNEISLETLYTRCCHLREILPIPATLKQLKKKSKPLHVLKMLNPKPTLIDVLSFSDFLAIAPIITVILDNVTIDSEMLKIILISLKDSKFLDKLSLRNVPIDSDGWNALCKFLRINKNIQKLDISQQRVKKSTDHSKILRSDLDWDLFIDTLVLRGGIEELVINGCTLKTSQLNNLVNKSLILKTKRLGLASSQLDKDKIEILSKWISLPNTTCNGIDFAFNNLSQGQLLSINNVLKSKSSNIKLQFFSLNSTEVQLNECIELIKNLSNLSSLKFLDLSNNSHLFPDILPVLRDYLPKYPDLRRLHFDFDNLTDFAIVQLCVIFQQCPNLVHISFLGNNTVTSKSAVAIYSAVKNSHIYNIDMDYDSLDEELVSKIAFYLMRNMEYILNVDNDKQKKVENKAKDQEISKSINSKSINSDTNKELISKDEDLIFDGSLLTKAAEHLLENDSHIEGEERLVIYRALVEKTIKLRTEIHDAMNKLFAIREKGKLSIEGKENLLRFCLLDDSLENILDIFSDEVSIVDNNNNNNDINNNNNNNNNNTNKKNDNNDNNRSPYDSNSRPSMIRKLSSQLSRHHSSDDILKTGPIISGEFYQHNEEPISTTASEAPHIVVADADSIPVDSTTGKRVLMRKFSQTSVHSKKLEEEEGELHRWGFFVQQQNDIMPDDSQNSKNEIIKKKLEEREKEAERLRLEAEKQAERERKKLTINTIPSGSELRETIMKVKGIESISDLIRKVNKDFTTVETIYRHADAKRATNTNNNNLNKSSTKSDDSDVTTPTSTANKLSFGWFGGSSTEKDESKSESISPISKPLHNEDRLSYDQIVDTSITDTTLSPTVSINSINDGDIRDQADEVYERILNNVIRVRSNK